MRTLILMRHAKSDWNSPANADHERPLNARGQRAAPMMGRHLSKAGIAADAILISSAVRAQQTWELLQTTWESDASAATVPELYLASPQAIAEQIEGLHHDWQRAMFIGHNPGLSLLASQLCSQSIELPTAAVVVLTSTQDSWQAAAAAEQWTLSAFWKPRELEASS